MKTYKLFVLVILILIMGSCGSKKDNTYDNVAQMVEDAEAGITKITVNELKAILDHSGEYKIIDCREEDEFFEGHIPGAINIPRGVLEFSSKISNRREAMYVYSQTVDRASLACQALLLLKYNKVYLIDGGWEEWNKVFPKLIEKDAGDTEAKTAPAAEESGGCG
ncbi:MAG: rhodanese-like domain-containing protein [Bacteroidetes bacterium]|nr:rhodanese-like domain-containing protein [Bacteroidota bacterium]